MRDPFRIDGPAVLAFSGGRTSGYMLKRVVDAHDGRLPDDVLTMFSNTGKELNETLDFVERCGAEWGVNVIWVEYRPPADGEKRHAIVNHATASRNGEPYEALIAERGMLPNPRSRFCRTELKTRARHRVMREMGFDFWTTAIGFRADEPQRVAKIRASGGGETKDEEIALPLADAGVTSRDVAEFWSAQPFDLELPHKNGVTNHGNCDLCFLKGPNKILSLIRESPKRAIWWAKQEEKIDAAGTAFGDGSRFRNDRASYAQMYDFATKHHEMFPFDQEDLVDCGCGG